MTDWPDGRVPSMDSSLEAFSFDPAHGSVAALAFPRTARANDANQEFLSYYLGLLSRPRVSTVG